MSRQIVTVDEAGATDGFLESGFTPAEAAKLAAWPDRERLFEHLRGLAGKARGGAFTDEDEDEDEEILTLFASQAGGASWSACAPGTARWRNCPRC